MTSLDHHSLSSWLPMRNWTLAAGRVDVIALDFRTPVEAPETSLNPLERLEFEAIPAPGRRRELTLGRWLVRTTLSKGLASLGQSIAPARIPLAWENGGKPSLVNDLNIAFNLTHSQDWAMLAVSLVGPVGVDLERMDQARDWQGLARRFFAPGEVEALTALPAERQAAGFHACWTRKEALLKALGSGIAAGLDRFEVTVDPLAAPAILRSALPGVEPEAWRLWPLPAPSGYQATLATPSKPCLELRLWLASPT